MMKSIQVDIVSAEAEIYSGTAQMVVAPAALGEVGIMPGHSPLLSSLEPGQVQLELENGERKVVYVSGGVLEVQPDAVTILSDIAERAEDLDEARILEEERRYRQKLTEQTVEQDYAHALAELGQLSAQLKAIEALKKIRKK